MSVHTPYPMPYQIAAPKAISSMTNGKSDVLTPPDKAATPPTAAVTLDTVLLVVVNILIYPFQGLLMVLFDNVKREGHKPSHLVLNLLYSLVFSIFPMSLCLKK
jgi:hypothetical protein